MTTASGYEFHPLFEKLWPLASEQYAALEEHIVRTGRVLDPIVIWKGTKFVVDGHSRLTIAEKHNLSFKTVELEFDSEEHVVAWMREHQLARRNLDSSLRIYHMGLAHQYWAAQAQADGQNPIKAATTKKAALTFGVTEKTIQNAVKHTENVEALAPAVKAKYVEGELQASVTDIAKLAALPKPQQVKATKMVESGMATTIGKAVTKVAPPPSPKNVVSLKTSAAKMKYTFADVEMQRTFDCWKKLMALMPQKVYRNVDSHCEAIFKELMKYQET